MVTDDLSRFNRVHLQHKRMQPEKAPQKQCKYPGEHIPHHYEGRGGLIWSCQGRGVRSL